MIGALRPRRRRIPVPNALDAAGWRLAVPDAAWRVVCGVPSCPGHLGDALVWSGREAGARLVHPHGYRRDGEEYRIIGPEVGTDGRHAGRRRGRRTRRDPGFGVGQVARDEALGKVVHTPCRIRCPVCDRPNVVDGLPAVAAQR